MLLWPMLTRKKRGKEVDSTIATELINHKDAQVIDIRSSDDYKAGHIARSRNFPATVIHHHLNEFDKTKPVLLISAAGDAKMVASLLKGMGFASVTAKNTRIMGMFLLTRAPISTLKHSAAMNRHTWVGDTCMAA